MALSPKRARAKLSIDAQKLAVARVDLDQAARPLRPSDALEHSAQRDDSRDGDPGTLLRARVLREHGEVVGRFDLAAVGARFVRRSSRASRRAASRARFIASRSSVSASLFRRKRRAGTSCVSTSRISRMAVSRNVRIGIGDFARRSSTWSSSSGFEEQELDLGRPRQLGQALPTRRRGRPPKALGAASG